MENCPFCDALPGAVHNPDSGRMEPYPIGYRMGDLYVMWRGAGWSISEGMDFSSVYNRLGEWEIEPRPSSREPDFFERCRYSLEDALRIAREIQETGAWKAPNRGKRT